jgi:hypothetical protein
MSIETVEYVVCDVQVAETCTNLIGDAPRSRTSQGEARLAARRQGWVRIDDRLDICPSCRPLVGR